MKKVLLFTVGLLLLSIKFSYAVDGCYSEHRSSFISVTHTDVPLTTATIRVWRIEVSSGNPGSNFTINGGTWTSNMTSTDTFDTSTTGRPQCIDQTYGGAFLSTIGSSVVRFYWDYVGNAPATEKSKGLGRR